MLRGIALRTAKRLQSLGMTKSKGRYAKAIKGKRHFKDEAFELL